jgi:hypothetical protein
MIPGNANPLLLASAAEAAPAGVATKSLRFNNDDSAHLTRTPSSGGNQKTWTWSGWVKRSSVSGSGTYPDLFGAFFGNSSRYTSLRFDPNDKLFFFGGAGSPATNVINLQTSQVFRDFSAWYHIVLAFDTTQSTASNRAKLYVNGAQITDFDTETYPAQNVDYFINQVNVEHVIGSFFGTLDYLDGYLADVYFIDGLALAPTSFGAYDDNGVWQAAVYSGTYGTNGFHLAFGDSSTDAALGTDSSGNGNTFTVNNLTTAPGLATAHQGFNCVTYTGNGGTQSVTGVGFQPDLVWFKSRSEAQNHAMFDVVRGVEKRIHPNLTQSEDDSATGLTAFNSDGFTVGSNNVNNKNNTTYVAWCWKAGGSPSSNTDGTITSSVSVNNTYGFSIINHVGTGAAGTFGHGLSSAPDFLIFKNREATDNWFVWTRALNDTNTGGIINSTNAFFTNGVQELNQTLPTDSVIHVANNLASNGSGQDVITYAWTEISGFSKFGSYTGNGSTDGPTVALGFKPRFILLRSTSGSRAWCIYDTQRDTSTTNDNNLFANNNSAESSDSSHNITILDDGFKLATTSVNRNGNGETYVYMAFADKPDLGDNDSLFDVPTNGTQSDTGAGGEVSGNYCVLNALAYGGDINAPTNGNLDVTSGTSTDGSILGTFGMSSGKWYFEVTCNNANTAGIGIAKSGVALADYPGQQSEAYVVQTQTPFYKVNNNTPVALSGTFSSGDVIGVAFDADNGNLSFYQNGSVIGSNAYTGLTDGPYLPIVGDSNSTPSIDLTCNFGQRAFAYSAPSGYKALCTTNLPTPTIADGSDYFDAKLWTGTGSSRSITGYSFSPDFVWIKKRSGTTSHNLFDIVRGANKPLFSDQTNAELSDGRLTAFNSDGFTLDSDNAVNDNNETHVGWAWDGGNLVTNSAYNQSQTWSSATLSNGSNLAGLFDGNLSTNAQQSTNGTAASITNFGPISVSSTVSFYSPDGDARYTLNGGTEQSFTGAGWHDISFTGTLTSFTFQGPGNFRIFIFGMKVDNKQLVDPGIIPADSVSSGVPSIASTVRANSAAGFSIVSFNLSVTNTEKSIGHGLNTAPTFYIIKNRSSADNWYVYTTAVDGTLDFKYLNTTDAFSASSRTLPTSSVFSFASSTTGDHIAYCFTPVAGYSAFGSYEGNGSSDGTFVHTGFRIAWLMIKETSGADSWLIWDATRQGDNPQGPYLLAEDSQAEVDTHYLDFLSNGFKYRSSHSAMNQSGANYIYIAFASNPFSANGGLAF